MTKVCSIEGCSKSARTRGWCHAHYARWKRNGDPLGGMVRFQSTEEMFAARTEQRGECLVWTAAVNPMGYGRVRYNDRALLAHRLAWELANGPIPEGLLVDHICHNPPCVNTEHLRLATNEQNQQNRNGPVQSRKHKLPRGVSPHGPSYRAIVHKGGTTHRLGAYETVEAAAAAVAAKRLELFGEFAGKG